MVKQRLYLILMMLAAGIYLAACCSKDNTCPAGDATESSFPYKFNQLIHFADTMGNSIKVKMANKLTNTDEYTVEGSCGMPRKDLNCSATTTLVQASVEDSANVLGSKKWFSVSIDKKEVQDDLQSIGYTLSAFGRYMCSISNYNGTNQMVIDAKESLNYKTPYKTYPSVYIANSNVVGSANYKNKTVFDNQGKLIAFTLNQDTTRFFYLVE